MRDLNDSLDVTIQKKKMLEAKRFSLGYKIESLQQLILQRFQALTTISSIAFAISGIIISIRSDLILNETLAMIAAASFALIALISLGRHLYLIRKDIEGISDRIRDLSEENWGKQLNEKIFKADWWPEVLYLFLVAGVVLFGLSII
ncbi:MAG TPA: hypothetical protein VJH63_03915 [Candidatus Paceibacterota bacterium]